MLALVRVLVHLPDSPGKHGGPDGPGSLARSLSLKEGRRTGKQKDRETTLSSCRMEGVFGAPGSWQLALLTTTCSSQDSVDEVCNEHTLYLCLCLSNLHLLSV